MSGWRRRVFDAPGLTQAPPGRYLDVLARRWKRTIYVTRPSYDDIGQILKSMGVEFEPFRGKYDCDLLFANCCTPDKLDPKQLRSFVQAGGCLYASDYVIDIVDAAFPGIFRFGRIGKAGRVAANIVDDELRQLIGNTTTIEFDTIWKIVDECKGTTLVEAARGTPYAGRPLMVEVEQGEGAIFFTCFHNRAQVSEQEKLLLQLLVLKQISASSKTTIDQAGQALGINLGAMRKSRR